MEAVLRRKCIAVKCLLLKKKKSQINNLTLHLKGARRANEAQV